jgi:hypothetical protein
VDPVSGAVILGAKEEADMNKNKAMCCGCYNEQYHHGLGGSMECWCYADSKIENRIPISVDIPPPYRKKDEKNVELLPPLKNGLCFS